MRRSRPDSALAAGLTLALVSTAAPAAAQDDTSATPPDAPAEEPAAPAPPSGVLLSGQLRTRYRGQFSEGDDHDLYELIDVQAKDAAGRWSSSLLGRLNWDLDDGPARLDSLQDTYDADITAQLYHAYLDWKLARFERLRFGRQTLYETPLTVVFDGAAAELAPMGSVDALFGAYAGLGEHLYESSAEDDWVLGSYGGIDLWSGATLRADWMHLEDARLGSEHENDLVGLRFSQDADTQTTHARVELKHSRLEAERRDVRVSASLVDLEARASLQVSWYQLLKAQQELAAPLDPFTSTLATLFPYEDLALSGTKDWKHLALSAGANLRRLEDEADESTYNREFERYWLTTSLVDTLPVQLDLTGELWDATGTEFSTWGASVAREFERFELSGGSYYSLYKYDLTTGDERDDVRTFFLDATFRQTPERRWSLRYEFEDNDFDAFHQLRLDYAWGF
jgi:hypothetical protein